MAYCDRDDIGNVVGASNVTTWADRDADQETATIAAVIAEAIATADAIIDGQFLDGPYAIPFSTVPQLVKNWAAKLSAIELYRGRGQHDTGDDPAGKLGVMEVDVRADMSMYSSGSLRLNLERDHSGPTEPQAVE